MGGWGGRQRNVSYTLRVEGFLGFFFLFFCNLIPFGHLQYSIGEWLLCCVSKSLRVSCFFLGGYFEKVRLKMSYLIWVGTPYHFWPHIRLLSFSNGKHIFVIIHFGHHTFPNVRQIVFLTCRYHLL